MKENNLLSERMVEMGCKLTKKEEGELQNLTRNKRYEPKRSKVTSFDLMIFMERILSKKEEQAIQEKLQAQLPKKIGRSIRELQKKGIIRMKKSEDLKKDIEIYIV